MPVKIRLARHGRKRKPFYYIVIADGRAPRDGRFIERVGSYNPNTNPATIDLDFEKALDWLQKGAQPTDTVRAILSYKGVLYKNHLLKGVKKGAFTEEIAEERFKDWVEEKASKIESKKEMLRNESDKDAKKRLAAETKVKDERAAAQAARLSKLAADARSAAEEEAEEDVPAEVEAVAEVVAEVEAVVEEVVAVAEPVVEEVVAETEAVVEEVVAETEAVVEEVVAEAKEEAPADEAKEEEKKEE